MSQDYPCVHYNGGKCDKFSDYTVTSYCVQGPCPEQTRSNADRIRAMSDEDLAERIWKKFGCPEGKPYVNCEYAGDCKDCWLEWLQQPAEEVD